MLCQVSVVGGAVVVDKAFGVVETILVVMATAGGVDEVRKYVDEGVVVVTSAKHFHSVELSSPS